MEKAMAFVRLSLLFLLALLVASACSNGRAVRDEATLPDTDTVTIPDETLTILDDEAIVAADEDAFLIDDDPAPVDEDIVIPLTEIALSVTPNPGCVLAAVATVVTDAPADIVVEFGPDTQYGRRTNTTSGATTHTFDVLGLRADSTYHIRATAKDGNGTQLSSDDVPFLTGPLPASIPAITVTIDKPELMQKGFTFFGPRQFINVDPALPLYLAVDEEGYVIWYYNGTGDSQEFRERDLKMLPDGNFLITLTGGFRVITPGGATVLNITGNTNDISSIHHEVSPLANGNFLFLSQETRMVNVPFSAQPITALGDVIVEIDPAETVVWRWSTFDHIDNTYYPTLLSRTPVAGVYDWTHANAIDYYPADNSLLLSMRHMGWVMKIDRATGAVIWRLGAGGDFTLIDSGLPDADSWFYGQHAPELQSDGSLLLYDNGNNRDGTSTVFNSFSRGTHYVIDETLMTAQLVWEYRTEHFTTFFGDADRLPNGNILLCAGAAMTTDDLTGTADLYEVTPEQPAEKVWQLTIDGFVVYRATRLTSFYPDE